MGITLSKHKTIRGLIRLCRLNHKLFFCVLHNYIGIDYLAMELILEFCLLWVVYCFISQNRFVVHVPFCPKCWDKLTPYQTCKKSLNESLLQQVDVAKMLL